MLGKCRASLIILLLFSANVHGQAAYKFLPLEKQLSQSTVTCILQDSYGFLWIGTRSGLNRYDGAEIKKYYRDQQDTSSLSDNYIRDILEDSHGNIWIATDAGGICKYVPEIDGFDRFAPSANPDNYNTASVHTIFEDSERRLWVGTQHQGLFLWNTQECMTDKNCVAKSLLNSHHIIGVQQDSMGTIWMGTRDAGVFRYEVSSKFPKPIGRNTEANLEIRSIHLGETSGKIFIGTNLGINVIHPCKAPNDYCIKPLTDKQDKPQYTVLSILEKQNGDLWIGTENEGLYVIAKKKPDQHILAGTNEYSIRSNSIWSLYEDRQSRTWVGTFNRGLFRMDPVIKKFDAYRHDANNANSVVNGSISAFAEDDKGNLWIGSDGFGVCYWDRSAKAFSKEKFNPELNEVLSLHIDAKENLWLGTWDQGLFLQQGGKGSVRKVDIKNTHIMDIESDQNGLLWLAGYRTGVLQYAPSTGTMINISDALGDEGTKFVRSIICDLDGFVWVGTENQGLWRLKQNSNQWSSERVPLQPSYKSNGIKENVITLKADGNNLIWIGTTRGLFLLDKHTLSCRKFDRSKGLADETIYSIEPVKNGAWFSTNNGLSVLDLESDEISNFNLTDGLQDNEFYKNSSIKLRSGELAFGGISGFNHFEPKQFDLEANPERLYFRKFQLSDNSLTQYLSTIDKPKIELKYDQNGFAISYAYLDLSQSDQVQYRYKLVGYENEWREVGTSKIAYYANVPSGNYTFELQSTDRYGRWLNNSQLLEIGIQTAWYATLLAYAIYITLFLTIAYILILSFLNREKLKNQLQLEHLELTKMQELAQFKTNFFTNISHELRSPLTLISGPLKKLQASNELSKPQRAATQLMTKHVERLLALINQLLELSKVESGKMELNISKQDIVGFFKSVASIYNNLAIEKYIKMKVNVPVTAIDLYFDSDKMEQILCNLLSNAIKYTDEFGYVTCSITESDSQVFIDISNTGMGIPKEELPHIFERFYRVPGTNNSKTTGSGIGLALTKELIEAHLGDISVKSDKDSGTTFSLTFSKGTQHLEGYEILQSIDSYDFEKSKKIIEQGDHESRSRNLVDHSVKKGDRPVVLVIEDNDEIRQFIESVLTEDFQVIQSVSGEEGIEMAIGQMPDMIVSDIMMGEVSGYEVCQKLKQDKRIQHIPILLLTAQAAQESEIQGLELGADYYLRKPFEPEVLRLKVRNAIRHSKMLSAGDSLSHAPNEPRKVKLDNKDQVLVRKTIQAIENHMSDAQFNVDMLSKELGYSRMQLYRKLKAIVGISANEFIRTIRLKRAAQLIVQNQLTISEITYEVGFNDLQYFRDCFKKQFGMTPSEYGEKYKEVSI